MSEKLQVFLKEIAILGSEKLTIWLPTIGGDNWWKFYVYQQLSIPQQKALQETSGSINELDSAAVFRVLTRNWSELCNHQNITNLRREGIKYAKEAIEIRNYLSHLPINARTSNADLIRYTDTFKRLAQYLGGRDDLLAQINNFYDLLLKGGIEEKLDSDSNNKIDNSSEAFKQNRPHESANEIGSSLISQTPNSTIANHLKIESYIGIDFGTSTTVVSIVKLDPNTGLTKLTTLSVDQPTEFSDFLEHHLINSVLTEHKGKLLFGSDAARLKVRHIEGETSFSSFKMHLGLNLPNRYPNTKVKSSYSGKLLRSSQEVAVEFFKLLRDAIEKALGKNTKDKSIKYAISVPASFEANQRRDLLSCLNTAGFPIESSSLIDEPNAAFLSYLHDNFQRKTEFAKEAKEKSRKTILVFDFGAGTCDISILDLKIQGDKISSQNLAISRFMALGGDDIDRVIAKKFLLKHVRYSNEIFKATQDEINDIIIPWLKPAAEELKIACTDELIQLQIEDPKEARNLSYITKVKSPQGIEIRETTLSISQPSISIQDYVEVIELFSKDYEFNEFDEHGEIIVGEPKSIIAPITNAISKAGLEIHNIDSVLFIGGSAKSTLIRNTVMGIFPQTTEALVPQDLQTHVSKGAALHCLGHYALGQDFVQPITSEPIYLITRGAKLKMIMPAGSPVPSSIPFVEKFKVARDGQIRIELPICVSNENKLLGIIKINAINKNGFIKDQEITLSCQLTHDKLLTTTATIGSIEQTAIFTNPLTNKELSETELQAIEAKQKFQESILENNGRPSAAALLTYANALMRTENYLDAADHFIQLETLKNSNHATNICYCYSQGGLTKESNKWAKTAYERKKTEYTCFNYALQFSKTDKERYVALLKEALEIDPNYASALNLLGSFYMSNGDENGANLLEKAAEVYVSVINDHTATRSDCDTLERIAEKLGRDDLIDIAQGRKDLLIKTKNIFKDENLAVSDRTEFILESQ
jgi:molecular chaperone DnaK